MSDKILHGGRLDRLKVVGQRGLTGDGIEPVGAEELSMDGI